jgi:hypothetical protein
MKEIIASATELAAHDSEPLPTENLPPIPTSSDSPATASSWLSWTSDRLAGMDAVGKAVNPYLPALQEFAYEQTMRMGSDFIRNDECMAAVIGTAYTVVLPAPVRLVVPQAAFVRFGLSQIDRIFGPQELP